MAVLSTPLLTVLSYSGGRQSSALLWMLLCEDIPRPEHLVILNADPGMENSKTYEYTAMMLALCHKANITAFTVDGPSLVADLLHLKDDPTKKRIDNPPYWTKDGKTGKQGRLIQNCTKHYKIAPMDRAIRRLLEERYALSRKNTRLPPRCVHKWIGFSYDEVFRMKPPSQKYVEFVYPLIDMQLTNEAIHQYYLDNHLPEPPRSVCNACFANGLATFRQMWEERPDDWAQAVAVDDSVRDWSQIGVRDAVYVSKTMVPLRDLPRLDFNPDDSDSDNYSCDSGYCFT